MSWDDVGKGWRGIGSWERSARDEVGVVGISFFRCGDGGPGEGERRERCESKNNEDK